MSRFDFYSEIACYLLEAHVGYRGEYRFRCGCNVLTFLDGEEVGRSAFVEIFFLFRVEIQHGGVSERVCAVAGVERGGVVATDFPSSCSFGCDAVEFTHDTYICRAEPFLEVWSYGTYHDHEHVFVGRFYAYTSRHSDLERAYVERCAATVGGHEAFVEFYHPDHHFAEQVFRYRFHHDAFCRFAYALCVFFQSEYAYFAVFSAKCFQSFEYLLSVVEGCGRNMHLYCL